MEPGSQLSHYTVVEAIGRGGMGEVWRARDNKLDRDVAIKTLPEEFARDQERLARFEREAKLLASVNHPNIASIHGIEEEAGTRFLVLELVEGDTLAERLARGAIPPRESLKLALQIAEALEAAHEKGVVHRDLKPANIKVTPDGRVKVLDFGLAKAFGTDDGESSPQNSPTLSMQATRAGVILGTAGYMAPEQARGESTDRRVDVWAFGCVLFEMLTGQGTFDGKTVSDVLASVLKTDPEWDSLPENLHPRLRMLLERCLEKEARNRYSGIADARVDIESVLADPAGPIVEPVSEAGETAPSRPRWPVAVAALVVGSLLTAGTLSVLAPRDVAQTDRVRFVITSPDEVPSLLAPNARDVAISPDGTRIAFNGTNLEETELQVYVRFLREFEAAPVRGAIGWHPFFSADGEWVGFVSPSLRSVLKVSVYGGPPVMVADSSSAIAGATWTEDNQIIFGTTDGLMRVSDGGGEPVALTTPDREAGERSHRDPFFVPGRGVVLFAVDRTGGPPLVSSQIAALDLESGAVKSLNLSGVSPHYVSTGHLAYAVEDGSIRAVPFEPGSLEVTGSPVPVVDNVSVKEGGIADFSIATNGRLAYIAGGGSAGAPRSLVWVNRSASEEALNAPVRGYTYPRISPDGRRIALDVRDDQQDIMVWDIERETLSRFTPTEVPETYPVWSADSSRIAYASPPNGVFWKAANGSGVAEQLGPDLGDVATYFFSPTGNEVVYRATGNEGWDIAMVEVNAAAESAPTLLLDSRFNEANAELSPNGRWMAYESDESSRTEIFVRPFPNVEDGRYQVSSGGGTYPLWGPGGDELFFLEPGSPVRLVRVAVETGEVFDHGSPERLMDWPYHTGSPGRNYDVSPDGERFLAIKTDVEAGGESDRREIHVVLNWDQELLERVPIE